MRWIYAAMAVVLIGVALFGGKSDVQPTPSAKASTDVPIPHVREIVPQDEKTFPHVPDVVTPDPRTTTPLPDQDNVPVKPKAKPKQSADCGSDGWGSRSGGGRRFRIFGRRR